MLLLPSCGGGERPSAATPPAERFGQVAAPAIPEATTPCHFDAGQLCNSDEETAGVIGSYDAALAEANRRLAWLRRFFGIPE